MDQAISIKHPWKSFSRRIPAQLEGTLLVVFFFWVQTYLYYGFGVYIQVLNMGEKFGVLGRMFVSKFFGDLLWESFKFPKFHHKSSIYSKNWAPTSYTNRVTTPCYRCLESQWTIYFWPFVKGPSLIRIGKRVHLVVFHLEVPRPFKITVPANCWWNKSL